MTEWENTQFCLLVILQPSAGDFLGLLPWWAQDSAVIYPEAFLTILANPLPTVRKLLPRNPAQMLQWPVHRIKPVQSTVDADWIAVLGCVDVQDTIILSDKWPDPWL